MQESRLNVLLIAYDLGEADKIRAMLSESAKQKFSVQHVRSLADGIGLLRSRDFDAILVDLALPDSQGLETALAVRNQAIRVPIIILTSLDDEDMAQKAFQSDIQDYLLKGEITGGLLQRSIRYAIQRKRDSEELRESKQCFESFMLNLPAAGWIKDLDGRYLYANAEAERTFSLPLSEFIGKRDEEFLPPETARQFVENDRRVLAEGGNLRTTDVLRQADGIDHLSIVSKFAVPAPDGQAAYVAGVAFDITERVQAEGALRESEALCRTMFDSIDEGFCTIEVIFDDNDKPIDYRFLETNASFERQTGLVNAQGKRMRELAPNHEEHWFEIYGRIAKTGEPARFQNRAEQLHRWYNVFAFRVGPAEDRKVGILFDDITERRRSREEIERLNADLAARAAELETANKDLEAFNYSVAHDLRRPLTAISSYCQVIRELYGDKLDEQCTGYLQKVYDSTLRMNRLIGALLKFSRLGHVEPRRERVDLSAIAHEVALELTQSELKRLVTFRIADKVIVEGDWDLLRVVLDNLLGNAWKYTGMREKADIEFGVKEINGKPAYFVRDNGEGFDMADAGKLFTPFERLPGTNEHKGFGIGLATAERVILRHGGRIWAEGEPGKGATFYFTLG